MKLRILTLSAALLVLGGAVSGASAQSAAAKAAPPNIPTVPLNNVGYVVYLTDFPTRGRSQYVPGVDGTSERPNLNIRTAPNLEDVGLSGNGHMMMLEKNSDGIIKFVIDWLQKNVGQT